MRPLSIILRPGYAEEYIIGQANNCLIVSMC